MAANRSPNPKYVQIYDKSFKELSIAYPFLNRAFLNWLYEINIPPGTEITIVANEMIANGADGRLLIPDQVADVEDGPVACTEIQTYSDSEIFKRLNHSFFVTGSKLAYNYPGKEIRAGVVWLHHRTHPVEYLTYSRSFLNIQDIPPGVVFFYSKSAADLPIQVILDNKLWIFVCCIPLRYLTVKGHLRKDYSFERFAQEIQMLTDGISNDPEVRAHPLCRSDLLRVMQDTTEYAFRGNEFAEIRAFLKEFFQRKENDTTMLLKSISDERDAANARCKTLTMERDMYLGERDAANARCNTLTMERDMYYNERDMYRSERDAAYAKIAELERRLAGFQR